MPITLSLRSINDLHIRKFTKDDKGESPVLLHTDTDVSSTSYQKQIIVYGNVEPVTNNVYVSRLSLGKEADTREFVYQESLRSATPFSPPVEGDDVSLPATYVDECRSDECILSPDTVYKLVANQAGAFKLLKANVADYRKDNLPTEPVHYVNYKQEGYTKIGTDPFDVNPLS